MELPAVVRFVARHPDHLKQSLETLLLKKRNRNAEDAFVLTWLGNPRFFRGFGCSKDVKSTVRENSDEGRNRGLSVPGAFCVKG